MCETTSASDVMAAVQDWQRMSAGGIGCWFLNAFTKRWSEWGSGGQYVRFARWETYGVWHRVAEALQGEADMEELFIDATIVRAHQHAAGAPKKTVAIRRSVARAGA